MMVLAAFASSDEGQLYAASCERWGVDPGAILDDDVMAINLRVGLAKALSNIRDAEESDEPESLKLATRNG